MDKLIDDIYDEINKANVFYGDDPKIQHLLFIMELITVLIDTKNKDQNE